MIEFHAGTGPDTQAVGIALEEMFLDYRVAPGRSPVPIVTDGGARIPGAAAILLMLARKTDKFLPGDIAEIKRWTEAKALDLETLDALLAKSDFILGDFSIADMAVYPRIADDAATLPAHPAVARWAARMMKRPATGRGMTVVQR
jgi:glutathione S-transferase